MAIVGRAKYTLPSRRVSSNFRARVCILPPHNHNRQLKIRDYLQSTIKHKALIKLLWPEAYEVLAHVLK